MKRKTHKYANGGQVIDHLAPKRKPKGCADGGKVKKAEKKPRRPTSETLGP